MELQLNPWQPQVHLLDCDLNVIGIKDYVTSVKLLIWLQSSERDDPDHHHDSLMARLPSYDTGITLPVRPVFVESWHI